MRWWAREKRESFVLNITISKRSAFMIVLAVLLVVPAVAFGNDVFDDVSDTSVHADGIGFMKSSGVSVGCDATNYCPGDTVTRAQMGTFLYRLSGIDPATPPSVVAASALTADSATDADTLDGMQALDLLPGGTPPAGTTIRGSYFVHQAGTDAFDPTVTSLSFGFTLEGPPAVTLLRVGDSPTANCAGSATAPEAAPGYLCIYENDSANIANICSVSSVPAYDCFKADPYGFGVFSQNLVAGSSWSVGTWALTVPDSGVLTPLASTVPGNATELAPRG